MNIIATDAAEIAEFIRAEVIIHGEVRFETNDKATGRPVTTDATEVLARITEAFTLGIEVRETESADGRMMVQIHRGTSVYATYIRQA